MRLSWCTAKTAHRANLSVFRCTTPESSTYDEETGLEEHDYPWEFEVQDHLNRLRLPLHAPEFLLLGYDELGLAAVIEMQVFPHDDYCFIRAFAVAHRVSGQGLGGEALDMVHPVMAKYVPRGEYVVDGLVDRNNSAAKSVFLSRGYQRVDTRSGYEVWARSFDRDAVPVLE